MNILILGATGLAGAAILRALRADGHSVSGTCRVPDAQAGLLPFDLGAPGSIVSLLEETRPDVVISSLRGDFALQLEAHGLAADFLRRRGGRLLYLSTANVFDGDLSRPHYEDDALCSDSTYGQFKIACEGLLQNRLGRDCVILRPPEIWGVPCPRLHALAQNAREGKPVRTYENLSVNYTTDVQIARWVSFILEHELRGVFHVGTRDTSGYTAFLARLAARLGLPAPNFALVQNETAAYQAVLPGRAEIPEELQLSVDDVLDCLSKNAAI